MGSYTNNLFRSPAKKAKRDAARKGLPPPVMLKSCAIKRGAMTHCGMNSHYDIRAKMGDITPTKSNPDDIEGFMTTDDQFVDRVKAREIGAAAGQCHPRGGELISADVGFWPK